MNGRTGERFEIYVRDINQRSISSLGFSEHVNDRLLRVEINKWRKID